MTTAEMCYLLGFALWLVGWFVYAAWQRDTELLPLMALAPVWPFCAAVVVIGLTGARSWKAIGRLRRSHDARQADANARRALLEAELARLNREFPT